MKEILCAAILLTILVVGITVNAISTNGICNEMMELAKKIPSADSELCSEALGRLEYYWKYNQTLISAGASYDDTHAIDETLRLMRASLLSNDKKEFELQRVRFISAVERISHLERISFESIF